MLSMVSNNPSTGNSSMMAVFTLRKYLFLLAVFLFASVANAATFTISTPTANGTFTLTWSGARTYVELYEKVNGTMQKIGDKYNISGSLDITKPPGTYTFVLGDILVYGNQSGGPYTTGTTIEKSVTVSAPTVPPVTPASITVNPDHFLDKIDVSWAVTNGATSYELQRNGTTIYSGSATSHQPSSLAANTSYTFQVRACNSYGCSGWRVAATVSLQETFGVPTASTTGQYNINIMTPSSATHTRIEESDNASGPWNTIATITGNQSYPLTRINGTFYYRLLYCVFTTQSSNCTLRNQIKSIVVSQPKPSISASFTPSTINEGGSATLNWNSSNATSCSASGIGGVSLPSGSTTYTASNVMNTNAAVNVTVTCAGGGGNNSVVAPLNVNWVNDAPTISGIALRNINEDSSTGAIGFTVGDEETSASDLDVTATSSNTTLIPNGNIQLGGSGSSRTITVTPMANLSGSAEITVAVKDSNNAQSISKFMVNVAAVDDAPVIAAMGNVSVNELNETNVNVTITDVDSQVSGVNVTSSSPTLVTPTLSGSGNSYSINIKAARINSSTSNSQETINVNVPFGSTTVSRGFTVTVNNLTPQLWIEETETIGIYDLKWDFATSAAKIYENGADITTTINSQGFAGPTGTKRITKTSNGTFTYYIQDCMGVTLQGLTCSGTYSQKVHNVIFPIPAAPAFKPNPTPNNTGSYSIEWNGVPYAKRYELFENDLAVDNGGNLLFQIKNYSQKLTGLYNYKVRACNQTGCSPFSAIQIIKVANPLNITAVMATMNGATGVANLLVTNPSGASYYEVQSRVNLGSWSATQTFTSTNITLPAVSSTGNYTYQVRACDAVSGFHQCSAWVSSNSTVMPVPATPTLNLAAASTTGSYSVSWSAVANSNRYILNENGNDLPALFTTSHGPVSKANGSYLYKVKACNSAACSGYSPAKSIDVVSVDAMSNVVATLDQNTAMPSATWSSVGGANSYEIQLLRLSTPVGSTIISTSTAHTFAPVSVAGNYQVRVKACAQIGVAKTCSSTKDSNVVSPIVPLPPVVNAPSTSTSGVFNISWVAVVNAKRYELYENDLKIASQSTTSFSFSAASAKPTGKYKYQVKACHVVCGDLGVAATVNVLRGPDRSTSSTATSSAASVSLVKSPLLTDGIVNSPPIIDNPPAPVGTLGGIFKVNESGAATYSVAIAAPEGVAGVKPHMTIGYSSQSNNGLLGKGWAIGGLSAITRCRQTLSQDGAAKPITWTVEDRFCLDGQRLMLVGGTYGGIGSVYKTEIDTFVKVTAVGGTSGNPSYFTVEAKDGSVSTYGGAGSDASITTSKGILTWAIKRFTDNVGNPIVYVYEGGLVNHHIKEIRYAYGVDKTDTAYGARIVFEYENRADLISSYIAGFEIKHTKRLKNVKSFNGGADPVRIYDVNYQYASPGVGGYSQVSAITECGNRLDSQSCYPSTIFSWSNPQKPFAYEKPLGSIPLNSGKVVVTNQAYLDINGNGILDYVWSEINGYVKYAVDSAVTSASPVTYLDVSVGQDRIPKLEPIDYNGDGHQDLLMYRPNEQKWVLYLSVRHGTGWSLERQTIVLPFSSQGITIGDADSDGLADVFEDRPWEVVGSNSIQPINLYRLVKRTDVSDTSNLSYQFTGATLLQFEDSKPNGVNVTRMLSNKECVQCTAGKYPLGDFNGDGKTDLVIRAFGSRVDPQTGLGVLTNELRVYIQSSNNSYRYHSNIADAGPGGNVTNTTIVADINGDGLSDAIYPSETNWHYVANTGAGFTTAKLLFDSADKRSKNQKISIADINHDGLSDIVWRDTEYVITDSGSYSEESQSWDGVVGEDVVTIYVKHWNPVTASMGDTSILLDDVDIAYDYTFMDVNGDSWADQVATGKYGKKASTNMQIRGLSSAEDYVGEGYIVPDQIKKITDGLGNVTTIDYAPLGRTNHYLPIGDIKVVGNTVKKCYPERVVNFNPLGSTFVEPAKCVDITSYDVDTNTYYKQINNPFSDFIGAVEGAIVTADLVKAPVLEVTGPIAIVTGVESTAPSASEDPPGLVTTKQNRIEYTYQHLRMQAAGKGMLGFEYLASVDMQTGITTKTRYRQDWPYIGSPVETTTLLGDKVLSSSTNTWKRDVVPTSDGGSKIYQPYTYKTVEKAYHLDSTGTVGTTPAKTVTTTTEMTSDGYGNVKSINVTTASGNDVFAKITTNYFGDDEWHKRMGRLTLSSVRTTRNGEPETNRNVSFNYYPQGSKENGLLWKEIAEQGTGNEITTEYTYDNFGNKTEVKVTGLAEVNRVETRTTKYNYGADGRYLVSTTNDFSQTSTIHERDATGQPAVVSDINGVGAEVFYDVMGKEYLRKDGTGAWTRTDTYLCGWGCPSGGKFYTLNRKAGGGESATYFDSLGRAIRSSKTGFDGRNIFVDTEYDQSGRIKRQSNPYFQNEQPSGWTTNEYDVLGRITKVTAADDSYTTNRYEGYRTTTTTGLTSYNTLGIRRTEIHNGLGQLTQVIDNVEGSIVYTYNTNGTLKTATTLAPDVTSPVTIRMCYDSLGRKIGMLDPDKGGWLAGNNTDCSALSGSAPGWWRYGYNAFGELISQTDAKGQVTTMKYDQLGRMVLRKDEDQTRWFYDKTIEGSSPAGSQGKLMAVIVRKSTSDIVNCLEADHCTYYYFDQYGRATDTLLFLPDDVTGYISSTSYDSIGRVFETRDMLNGAVLNDSGTQTHYNAYGYAYRTIDIAPLAGGSGVLSQITKTNARGQVTEELRSNSNIIVTYVYKPKTGLLESQKATTILASALGLASSQIQDETYDWDVLGNLKSRLNKNATIGNLANKNLAESFCYDALNRLVKTVNGLAPNCSGTQDIVYNGLGNIRFKKGVGDYAYGVNAGPHAVTNAGGVSYQYDANGNQTHGDGRTISYTTYDRVRTITKNGNSSTFKYAGDRARWQRIDVKGSVTTTTTYLGNIERIQTSSSTDIEWKRYVGGAIFTYKTNNNHQLQTANTHAAFVFNDHLGSVSVITDVSGKLTHSMGFDPWGARRNGENWAALSDSERVAALRMSFNPAFTQPVTTRGYTGHEMVDDMGIIHMNGRIYDARLGRFLQADIIIDGVKNTQGYNRYSYVHNNPLNATDPSGFSSWTDFRDKLRPYVGLIVGAIMTYFCGLNCGQLGYVMVTGATAGAVQALANGGNLLQGALTGMVTAAVFYGIGQSFNGTAVKDGGSFWSMSSSGGAGHIFAHAMAGGVLSALQGGKFGHGFAAAGLSKGFDANFEIKGDGPGAFFGETTAVAVVGGTISKMTGGKFKNGAATATFQHLFNELTQKDKPRGMTDREKRHAAWEAKSFCNEDGTCVTYGVRTEYQMTTNSDSPRVNWLPIDENSWREYADIGAIIPETFEISVEGAPQYGYFEYEFQEVDVYYRAIGPSTGPLDIDVFDRVPVNKYIWQPTNFNKTVVTRTQHRFCSGLVVTSSCTSSF